MYTYDPYGHAKIWAWPIGDVNRDSVVSAPDDDLLAEYESGQGVPTNDPTYDLDLDGAVYYAAEHAIWSDYETGVNSPGTIALTYSALDNPYLFTGRETDTWHAHGLIAEARSIYGLPVVTGMVDPDYQRNQWNRNRNYDPKHGRWLQRDPLGVRPDGPGGGIDPAKQYTDGMNAYEYVRSNPARFTDPAGLVGTCKIELVCWGAFYTGNRYHHCEWQVVDSRWFWNVGSCHGQNGRCDGWHLCCTSGCARPRWMKHVRRPDHASPTDIHVVRTIVTNESTCLCLKSACRYYPATKCYAILPRWSWEANSNTQAKCVARRCGLPTDLPPKVSAPGWDHEGCPSGGWGM